MKAILLLSIVLSVTSCGFSQDEIDYTFSSEIRYLDDKKIKEVLKIEVYVLPESEGKHFTFGIKRSTKDYSPIKVFNTSAAQIILNLISKNTGTVENCHLPLSSDVFHFVVRIKNSEKIGYFLAQPCGEASDNTVRMSYMFPDGDNATAFNTSIYPYIN